MGYSPGLGCTDPGLPGKGRQYAEFLLCMGVHSGYFYLWYLKSESHLD